MTIPDFGGEQRLKTFQSLEGFDDTRHLAPILLPAESRYRELRTREQVRDALLALSDEDRAMIITDPAVSDVRVVQIDGTPSGNKVKVKVSYDDTPVT